MDPYFARCRSRQLQPGRDRGRPGLIPLQRDSHRFRPNRLVPVRRSRLVIARGRWHFGHDIERGDVMAMRILWPNLPARLVPVATEAVGSGFELEFREKFKDVSDEQWAKADAVVGGCPPPYIDKLRACRIFVKYGVGYDDVDIERFGK